MEIYLNFIKKLKLLVTSCELEYPSIDMIQFYFKYNEREYLLHFSDAYYQLVSKNDNNNFDMITTAIYDDNLNYIGVERNSLIKNFDFNSGSVLEFLNQLN